MLKYTLLHISAFLPPLPSHLTPFGFLNCETTSDTCIIHLFPADNCECTSSEIIILDEEELLREQRGIPSCSLVRTTFQGLCNGTVSSPCMCTADRECQVRHTCTCTCRHCYVRTCTCTHTVATTCTVHVCKCWYCTCMYMYIITVHVLCLPTGNFTCTCTILSTHKSGYNI